MNHRQILFLLFLCLTSLMQAPCKRRKETKRPIAAPNSKLRYPESKKNLNYSYLPWVYWHYDRLPKTAMHPAINSEGWHLKWKDSLAKKA
jgi:hypothetical protein